MGVVPAPSLRPSFGAPTALQGPHDPMHSTLTTYPPSRKAPRRALPRARCRAHPLCTRSRGGHWRRQAHSDSPALVRPLGVGALWQQPGPGPTNRRKGRRVVGLLGPHPFLSFLTHYTPACPRALTHLGSSRLSDSPQAGHLGRRVHTDLWVASHVVHIDAQEVPEPMRHEHGSQVGLQHGVDTAAQDANAGQSLQVDAVRQPVQVRPPDACGTESAVSCGDWQPPRAPQCTVQGTQSVTLAEAGRPEVRGKGDEVPQPQLWNLSPFPSTESSEVGVCPPWPGTQPTLCLPWTVCFWGPWDLSQVPEKKERGECPHQWMWGGLREPRTRLRPKCCLRASGCGARGSPWLGRGALLHTPEWG